MGRSTQSTPEKLPQTSKAGNSSGKVHCHKLKMVPIPFKVSVDLSRFKVSYFFTPLLTLAI
jgi:hypothetical protein